MTADSLALSAVPAQDLCRDYDIPTGSYEVFRDPEAAKRYIQEQGAPSVVKAVGPKTGDSVAADEVLVEFA